MNKFLKVLIKSNFVLSSLFSLLMFQVILGLSNLNPRKDGWLAKQDGTGEISWEFFRHTPIFQWPITDNSNYGLENALGISFDGSIIIFSLLLKPLNLFLTDRFQYVGLSILIGFFLNLYIGFKIFKYFKFNNLNSFLATIILSTSPIILDRIIQNTHASLIHFWIIFISLLFYFKKFLNPIAWAFVSILSIMLHLYLTVFVLLLYLITNLISYKKIIKNPLKIVIFFIINAYFLWILGYLSPSTTSETDGYGVYKTSITSLIDSEDWSRILPDLPSIEYLDDYEGFAYFGISVFIISIILVATRIIGLKKTNVLGNFIPLFIVSILLYIYSLSNKITFLDNEIVTFGVPKSLDFIVNTFRSTGRFSWLLVVLVLVYLIVKLSTYYTQKHLSLFLIPILIIHLYDIYPESISQKNLKYENEFKSSLQNKIWHSIADCYENIRFFPPTSSVNNLYDFAKFASSKKMGINSGRFGRLNENFIRQNTLNYQDDILIGNYTKNSAYVFTGSRFYSEDVFNFYKDVALRTVPFDAGWQVIDGFFTILPNIKKCRNFPINDIIVGPPQEKLYSGQHLSFTSNSDNSKYNLYSFSSFENFGIETVGKFGRIIINLKESFYSNYLEIKAKPSSINNVKNNGYYIKINSKDIGYCDFQKSEFEICSLKFESNTNILIIDIYPEQNTILVNSMMLK